MRLVKVLLQHQGVEKATWEREDTMQATCLFLLEDEGALFNIESQIFGTRIIIAYACVFMSKYV